MLPGFILPETTIREAGTGPEIDLGDARGGLILLTLGITSSPSRRNSIAAHTRSWWICATIPTFCFCARNIMRSVGAKANPSRCLAPTSSGKVFSPKA